jgi:hypothetical protein
VSRTFDQLITAYGEAEFDLGTCGNADDAVRQVSRAQRDAARAELVKALRRAGLPVGAVAVVA